MNSLDQAISLQLDSINILERHNPDAKAVEKARDAAKSAAKILDAAVVMMSFGIYSVAEPPVDKFTDPNDYTISFPEVPPSEALPAVAAEIVAALPPMPDLLAGFPEDSEEQLHAFTHAKNNLIGAGQKSGLGPMDWSPDDWDEAWEADRLECIRRLVYATEFRTPTSWAYPSDEEFTAWCAGFAPVLPAMPKALSAFDAWDETEQTDVFTERLNDLGAATEGTPAQFELWEAAWEQDRRTAWILILVAEARGSKSMDLPLLTVEEQAQWAGPFAMAPETPEHIVQFCNAAPDAQMALYEGLLGLLEEEGVRQGLKRKDWKKARQPWQDLFITDRMHAYQTLWQAYHDHAGEISWQIPEPPTVDPLGDMEGGEL